MSRTNNAATVEDVAAIARRQLDVPANHVYVKNAIIIKSYIQELKKHVGLYPEDTNFQVELEVGRGYGVVTCLEAGCKKKTIKLVERVEVIDGGKSVGFGSLSAYRMHISNSPMHEESRTARLWEEGRSLVKAEPQDVKPFVTPRPDPGWLRALQGSSSPTGSKHATQTTAKPHTPASSAKTARIKQSAFQQAGPSVKPEPVEPLIPRKRASSDALNAMKLDERLHPHVSQAVSASPTRVKMETQEKHKAPLSVANRDEGNAIRATPNLKAEQAQETREDLAAVNSSLSKVSSELRRVKEKKDKTPLDRIQALRLSQQVAQLQVKKRKLEENLPPSMHKAPSAFGISASSSNVQLPPAFHHPSFARNVVAPATQVNIVQRALPPVASGSRVKLEASDDEGMEVDIPQYNLNPGNMAFDFSRIAPNVAGHPHYLDAAGGDDRFDDDGDFYGRGKDKFAGPIARADDIDKFLIEAGNSESFDGNASVDEALQKLRLKNLYQAMPGMKVALMPHQAIGVAWMLEKEKGFLSGGVLADDMGLGKTVQMIAVIAANRSMDANRKTTLIVAPVALLNQWKLEIDTKTDLGIETFIYHGSRKVKRGDMLKQYDIVLTTFQTLALEWPDDEAEEREKKKRKKAGKEAWIVDDSSEDERNTRKKAKKAAGPLFQMAVSELLDLGEYRVVLDEAQNIRNKRTRVSRAVSKLHSDLRWCLTGTPIINGLADAYGLLRFLHIRPWHDWAKFNEHITVHEKRQPMLATNRLQAVLQPVLLRRKKDSKLDGKPLIELPEKEIKLCKLEFTIEERDIYKMVETKSQNIFNKYLRSGTVLKNYYHVLVLLLRLRQVCSHPSLIQENGVAYIRPGEETEYGNAKRSSELDRAAKVVGEDFVVRMKNKFRQFMLDRIAAEQQSADATLEGEDWECPICFDGYTEAVITACGHTFCRECISNVLNGPRREDANENVQYKEDQRPCPTCRGPVSKETLFSRSAFEPTDAELNVDGASKQDSDVEMKDPTPAQSQVLGKRGARARRVLDSDEEADDMRDFIVEDDEDEEEAQTRQMRLRKGKQRAIIIDSDDEFDDDIIYGAKRDDKEKTPDEIALMPRFLPSTKMKYMMESLRKWAQEHPDEKVLVISQWTQCLKLVSDYLTEHSFVHVKYQGDMSRNKRDQAVKVFMDKDKATVMLMSLKCGGVGLNLTRANRVISLDLGWSLAVEQQAYDRVHRLGQHRPVLVQRLVISNTVEDRILALQERKQNLADGSLGEGAGKKIGRLSVKELANLFGLDHRGRVLTND